MILLHGLRCDQFLVGVMEEYSGSVLRADVITLAIEGGGVMGEPEDKEDMVIGDDIGVEGEVDCFGVA